MKTLHVALLTAGAALFAASGPGLTHQQSGANSPSASLPSGGMLRTMPHGTYQCALPGDAGGEAYQVVDDEGFRISTASRYFSEAGAGTYILRGDKLTFTAGPKNGQRFDRVGTNQLRRLGEDGKRSELLCTRLGSR